MKTRDLVKMRSLLATPKMMKMAAEDTLHAVKNRYWEAYNHGLYMRCHLHNNILKVAFFLTESMKTGGRLPQYEVYLSKSCQQFITYDTTHKKWLNAKLDLLYWPHYISCAEDRWISKHDEDTIVQYLDSDKNAYESILAFQRKIRHDKLMEQHKKETDKWDDDLAPIPDLPKDWERWVAKVGIQQNYILYEYSKNGASAGYCTFCEKDVPIKNPKYDQERPCPRCRKTVIYKSVGKAGNIWTGQYTMYLIQRFREGFVIRQFLGSRKHLKGMYDKPECWCQEIRHAIFDKSGKALRAYFWGKYKNQYDRWNATDICHTGSWGHDPGMVYGKTLPHLAKKELRHTGLIEMLRYPAPIDPEKYLVVYGKYPQIERLAKADLPRMARQCLSEPNQFLSEVHDKTASSLTKMLGINTQELKRLRINNAGIHFLIWMRYEKTTGRAIDDRNIKWLCTEQIMPRDIQFVRDRMSVVQICNYIRRQMLANGCKSKAVLGKWADYLSMARSQKMDTNDEIIYRVNKLFQRHDELVVRCNEKDLAIQAGKILEDYPHVDEIYESIKEKFEYADDVYTVLVPSSVEEVLREGKNLQHCVAHSHRYWERIERRETFVLFLRRTADVTKSYYTLEVEPNGTVRQKRTMYDRQEADIEHAMVFLKKWQAEVAKRLTQEDQKLAEESRILRNQSFTQLRNDQVIIHTGTLAGQHLLDVLLADLMENTSVASGAGV